MVFAKTFETLEQIENLIKESMPFDQYSRGCHAISKIGAKTLQKMGFNAESVLVALWKRATKRWVPHWVVIESQHLIDFKMRCFGRTTLKEASRKTLPNGNVLTLCKKIMVELYSCGGKAQYNGFYPSGNRYLRNPSEKDFTGKDRELFRTFKKWGPYNVKASWKDHVANGLKATSVLFEEKRYDFTPSPLIF